MEKDLNRDRSDWYIHKNHVLRAYFHSIEEWFRDHFWLHERIVQCNTSVHEAMQQVLKDTWMETRIQSHAFIRWFGDLDNEQEHKLFYSVQFTNEERYFWSVDLYECVDDYRAGVVDKYYKEVVAEREERREGYWKRHPDVYGQYKVRHVDTVKRYKTRLQEKRNELDYLKREKLDILDEADLGKIQREFMRTKQQNQMKQKRQSQTGGSSRQQQRVQHQQSSSALGGRQQSSKKVMHRQASSSQMHRQQSSSSMLHRQQSSGKAVRPNLTNRQSIKKNATAD